MTLSGSGDGLWTYLAVSAYGSDQALPLTDDTVAPATENVWWPYVISLEKYTSSYSYLHS